MKFRIATQLAIVLVLVGLLAAGVTGFFVYQISRDLLIQSAKNKLLTSTLVLSRRIVTSRQEVLHDLQVLAEHSDTQALLTKAHPASGLEKQLTELFCLIMEAHPAYLQIRLISASDYGLERIRVDRKNHQLVKVPPNELQEKGHYPYVSEALKLPPHSGHMSRITSRQEPSVETDDKPTMLLSMPVFSPQGKAIGVAAITIDINHEFSRLSEDLPHGLDLYLANGQGDVLIHPDTGRTFGFDTGRCTLIQDEFPATKALLAGQKDRVLFETIATRAPRNPGVQAMVAAFVRQGIEMAAEDDWLYIGLSQPLADVLEESRELGHIITRSMLLILPACLILAIILAKIVSRPIDRLREATHRFSQGESIGELPLLRQDEFGDLARSFRHMQNTITEQLKTLKRNQSELEQLIRHDPLTGLPNRRLLSERLEHAIALSRRGNYGVALLFIDLDGFKKINDELGHGAGDTVLVTVAHRLLEKIRVTDTAARLGGDEFVVLLVGAPHHDAVSAIALSMVKSIQEDILFNGKTLRVGTSIGISCYPEDGQSASELLTSADHAMYRVKNGKQPGFAFATPPAPFNPE